MRKPLVIGICGGSGSGKTAIANALFKYYKGTSLILNQDFYYKDLSSMSFTSRCKQNFDHPDSIDAVNAGLRGLDLGASGAVCSKEILAGGARETRPVGAQGHRYNRLVR